jgi:hypothetical protein
MFILGMNAAEFSKTTPAVFLTLIVGAGCISVLSALVLAWHAGKEMKNVSSNP